MLSCRNIPFSICGVAAAKLPAIDHHAQEEREKKKMEVIDYKSPSLVARE